MSFQELADIARFCVPVLLAIAVASAWSFRWGKESASKSLQQPVAPPALARVEVQLAGTAVRTDIVIDLLALEAFANGIGKTLTALPSTAKH